MNRDTGTGVGGQKDKLVADLKNVVTDAEELLREVARSTTEEVSGVRAKFGERLGEARIRLDDARAHAGERAQRAADASQEYVHTHPWQIIAVAIGVGLILGALTRHR
jgi:ElaB/YqjD/DUF883 family membrane-anchored ribosome-binding protein